MPATSPTRQRGLGPRPRWRIGLVINAEECAMNRRSLACVGIAVSLALPLPPQVGADEPFLLKDGQRVVFLGDSNTFAGLYIAYLDGYLRTRFPDKRFELINLGLPSETASGLSEPDHPYPRPDVHTRVEQALAR